jgi:hypothetical protein
LLRKRRRGLHFYHPLGDAPSVAGRIGAPDERIFMTDEMLAEFIKRELEDRFLLGQPLTPTTRAEIIEVLTEFAAAVQRPAPPKPTPR